MTAPIRVVDLTNVPLELRGDSPLFSAQHSHLSPYLPPGSGRRRCVTTPGHSTNTYVSQEDSSMIIIASLITIQQALYINVYPLEHGQASLCEVALRSLVSAHQPLEIAES